MLKYGKLKNICYIKRYACDKTKGHLKFYVGFMSKKVKTGLIIGIVALICVIAIVLVFVFLADKGDEHKHTLTHSDAVAATCTEDGSVEYWTCTECGKHFADENAAEELDSIVVPALGHDFADYEVETAATCTQPGEEVCTCSRCGEEQSRTIAALGHDYIEHAGQPATCTESGWEDYVTCTRCDYTTYQPIPSAGHKAEVKPRTGSLPPPSIRAIRVQASARVRLPVGS